MDLSLLPNANGWQSDTTNMNTWGTHNYHN